MRPHDLERTRVQRTAALRLYTIGEIRIFGMAPQVVPFMLPFLSRFRQEECPLFAAEISAQKRVAAAVFLLSKARASLIPPKV
jgi:hypothetical protein